MGRDDSARLGLLDLMLLVGGCAMSVGGYVLIDDALYDGRRDLFGLLDWSIAPWDALFVLEKVQGVVEAAASLFGAWILILPLLALRRPRSLWRRLFRGPGLTACLAAWPIIGFWTVATMLTFRDPFIKGISPRDWEVQEVLRALFGLTSPGVAAVWFVQAVTGRWRALPNAIDRLGRVIGVIWLLGWLLFAVCVFMMT